MNSVVLHGVIQRVVQCIEEFDYRVLERIVDFVDSLRDLDNYVV